MAMPIGIVKIKMVKTMANPADSIAKTIQASPAAQVAVIPRARSSNLMSGRLIVLAIPLMLAWRAVTPCPWPPGRAGPGRRSAPG
jgi:hypothetical protein